MYYNYCYPHMRCEKSNNQSRATSLLIPFVGGLLIGGLVYPYFKSNQPYYYPPYYNNYYPNQQYVPYNPGTYSYPANYGYYRY